MIPLSTTYIKKHTSKQLVFSKTNSWLDQQGAIMLAQHIFSKHYSPEQIENDIISTVDFKKSIHGQQVTVLNELVLPFPKHIVGCLLIGNKTRNNIFRQLCI